MNNTTNNIFVKFPDQKFYQFIFKKNGCEIIGYVGLYTSD